MNLANCIGDAWFRLGFQSAVEAAAVGAWVTAAELYQFADDAVKRLARTTALFLTYDSSIEVTPFVSIYQNIAAQVFTESAWIGTTTITSAVLSVTSSFSNGSYAANGVITLGAVGLFAFGSNLVDGGPWAKQTQTFALDAPSIASLAAGTMHLQFWIDGTLLGTGAPPSELNVYSASVAVTYSDGTTATMIPQQGVSVPGSTSTTDVVNPGNAIDGVSGDYTTVLRSQFSPLGQAWIYQLTAFGPPPVLNLAGAQELRITPVAALFALDQAYSQTLGPPTRICFDAAGADSLVVYPTPTVGGTIGQIMQQRPGDGVATLPVSLVLQDYFTNDMLRRARAKESDNAIPEVSEHLAERAKMYETVFQHLWGTGR
jgi:hypothetical protein